MKNIAMLLLCLCAGSLWADNCPSEDKRTHPDSRFVAVDNSNGGEVRDTVTGRVGGAPGQWLGKQFV